MNIQKMMKQAQEMQNKIAQAQARVEAEEAEGEAGSGAVKIRLNGKHEMLSLSLDASVVKADDKETLEDLIMIAYKNAKAKLDESASSQMKSVTSGLNLPAGMKLPF